MISVAWEIASLCYIIIISLNYFNGYSIAKANRLLSSGNIGPRFKNNNLIKKMEPFLVF